MQYTIIRKTAESVNFICNGRQYYLGKHSYGHDWHYMIVSRTSEAPTYGRDPELEFIMCEPGKRFVSLKSQIIKAIDEFEQSGRAAW